MKGLMADFIIPSLFLKSDKEEYFFIYINAQNTSSIVSSIDEIDSPQYTIVRIVRIWRSIITSG